MEEFNYTIHDLFGTWGDISEAVGFEYSDKISNVIKENLKSFSEVSITIKDLDPSCEDSDADIAFSQLESSDLGLREAAVKGWYALVKKVISQGWSPGLDPYLFSNSDFYLYHLAQAFYILLRPSIPELEEAVSGSAPVDPSPSEEPWADPDGDNLMESSPSEVYYDADFFLKALRVIRKSLELPYTNDWSKHWDDIEATLLSECKYSEQDLLLRPLLVEDSIKDAFEVLKATLNFKYRQAGEYYELAKDYTDRMRYAWGMGFPLAEKVDGGFYVEDAYIPYLGSSNIPDPVSIYEVTRDLGSSLDDEIKAAANNWVDLKTTHDNLLKSFPEDAPLSLAEYKNLTNLVSGIELKDPIGLMEATKSAVEKNKIKKWCCF